MSPESSRKTYNVNEAREKIRHYCAYRERSQVEVREKLYDYGLHQNMVEELLTELIQENFLNEERFARAFVRGKFSVKKWGRNKIRQALYRHHLSDYVLQKAFSEIDEGAYEKALRELLAKKKSEIKGTTEFRRNGKVAEYAIRRGYEPEMVWEIIKEK